MINLLKQGEYILGETKNQVRILYLDEVCYVWLSVKSIGDILSWTRTKHTPFTVFSNGSYKLYDVKDEAGIIDLKHLELETHKGDWQDYILLTQLPDAHKRRSRIISTDDNVSKYLRSQRQRRTKENHKQEVLS